MGGVCYSLEHFPANEFRIRIYRIFRIKDKVFGLSAVNTENSYIHYLFSSMRLSHRRKANGFLGRVIIKFQYKKMDDEM